MTTPAQDDQRRLTDEQLDAIARRDGPLLLSAGAGSGKTSVLVERFVAAVREDGVAPSKILAITFTERAAGELRARVRARLTQLGVREAARDVELTFISTFHGFCAALLRTRALLAGLDPGFEILDEALAARLRERAFTAALREFLDAGAERVDLLAAYGADGLAQMLAATYAQLRSAGERAPRIELARDAGASEPQAVRAVELLGVLLGLFGERYEELKRDRGAVDFDDLELLARDLLRDHESVRVQWSERFELLMVDEFQDTNARQLAILTAISRENLFTVGDELQAIYSFRHADVDLFRARSDELAPGGASLRLTSNFRSRPAILDVVNAAFAGRFGRDGPLLVAAREEARDDGSPRVELLLSARSGWERDERLAREIATGLPACPLWRQAEARALARRVRELIDDGKTRAGEVAVLLRAVSDMEVYEGALAQEGLATLATVGSFWEREQVADLLAYLRVLANPLDEPALLGVLASPLVGLSPSALGLLFDAAGSRGRGLWGSLRDGDEELLVALGERERELLVAFRERLASERDSASRRPIAKLIERALAHSGYRDRVLELTAARQRLANIHKLLRLAARFEAGQGRDLRGFLDYVDRREASSDRAEPDAPVDDVRPDAVRLMSVHAAKGLEFSVVCAADLGRRQNLGVSDLVVDGELVGLRMARLREGTREPALDFEALQQRSRREQAQEEDRILYVAMTRARERLLLSGAVELASWPEQREGAAPIAWLAPALAAGLPERVRAGAPTVFDQGLDAGPGEVRVRVHAPPLQAALPGLEAPREERPATATSPPPGQPRASERQIAATDAPAAARASMPAHARAEALSYTTLAELERCGYRYYLERVLRMPERRDGGRGGGAGGGLSARARGVLAHRLLESLDFARPRAIAGEDVQRAARELSMRVSARERGEVAELVNAMWSAGAESPDDSPGARVARAVSVHREHPFAFSLGPDQPLLSGVIDLLATEADGAALVVDYKTDQVAAEEDLQEHVRRDYEVQRLLYALAALRHGAARVEIVHWFLLRPRDWVSAIFQRSQQRDLEELLRARTAAAWRMEVSAHPRRALCESCPGRGTLCSYDEAVALAD